MTSVFVEPGVHLKAEAQLARSNATSAASNQWTYTFNTFFHPFAGDLMAQVNQTSVAGMLDPSFLSGLTRDYSPYYDKLQRSTFNGEAVRVDMPAGVIDLSTGGPYAGYNWELLYHIPIMVAVHLSQNQRFAEAERWFHLVFDPTFTDSSSNPSYPFWKFLGFRSPNLVENLVAVLSYTGNDPVQLQLRKSALSGYQEIFSHPFDPYAVARTRPLAFMYYVVMKYTDNLIARGDSLYLQNTPETINEARLCYVLAANLWGRRPQQLPARGTSQPMSYNDLKKAGMDAMGNALVDLEVQFPFNGMLAGTSDAGSDIAGASKTYAVGPSLHSSGSAALPPIAQILYFCFPVNQKLLSYWDIIADRLYKIRHCQTITGVWSSYRCSTPRSTPACWYARPPRASMSPAS
jgi:hypothetical protein